MVPTCRFRRDTPRDDRDGPVGDGRRRMEAPEPVIAPPAPTGGASRYVDVVAFAASFRERLHSDDGGRSGQQRACRLFAGPLVISAQTFARRDYRNP